MQFSHHLGRK